MWEVATEFIFTPQALSLYINTKTWTLDPADCFERGRAAEGDSRPHPNPADWTCAAQECR